MYIFVMEAGMHFSKLKRERQICETLKINHIGIQKKRFYMIIVNAVLHKKKQFIFRKLNEKFKGK